MQCIKKTFVDSSDDDFTHPLPKKLTHILRVARPFETEIDP